MRTLGRHATEVHAEIESRKSTQTSVDFLLSFAKVPRASTQLLSSLEREYRKVYAAREGMHQLAAAVGQEIEEQTELYVRETDEAYVRGLSAFTETREWDASVQRFKARLADYLQRLGEARSMASANYDRVAQRISPAAEEAIQLGVISGAALESEVTVMNELIEMEGELLKDTPVAGAVPPKLPVIGYADWTRSLRDRPIIEMHAEFGRILTYCEAIARNGLPALEQSFVQARAQGASLSHDYILTYIGTLREFSDSHWYKVSESERQIETLEKRYGKKVDLDASPDSHAGEASTNPAGNVAAVA